MVASSGWACEATCHWSKGSAPTSPSCTSIIPSMDRRVRTASGAATSSTTSRRRLAFSVSTSRASSSKPGAITTSVNTSAMRMAVYPSMRRLDATIPPNAETGSPARALT